MNGGVLISTLVERSGLTIEQLANRAGMPVAAVEAWELAHDPVTYDDLLRLARAARFRLVTTVEPETDIDDTLIQERLAMTPQQRWDAGAKAANFVLALRRGMPPRDD